MDLACEFDKLIIKGVPHIHEKIFFSLDYSSFKICPEVCKSWNNLLTSESFQRRNTSLFHEEIHKDLMLAAIKGNETVVERLLSTFLINVNFTREMTEIFSWLKEENITYKDLQYHSNIWSYLHSYNNKTTLVNTSPLVLAAIKGHKNVATLILDRGADPN